MKIHNIINEAINYASSDPKPEQDIVDKFAGVSDKLRSYYINKWAEEKGIDSDDAMFMAGYVQDGYIGAGAWNWRYVGMDESVQKAEQADLKKLAGIEENTKDEQLPHCHNCKGKGCDDCDNTGEDDGYAHGTKGGTTIKEGDSDEVMVAKMLSKALGDPNRWTEMSAPELYAELESTNSEVADMISKVAKMLYDVKLEERAYIDVGVADTVKDQRGKEFNFDKNTKKFKSQDGEEADINTKLGKDLMRIRKNQMKKTTPSYKTKKNQGK